MHGASEVDARMAPAPAADLSRAYRALRPPMSRRYSWRSPVRPLVYVLRALLAVPRLAPSVARLEGVGVRRQVLGLCGLLRLGFSSDDYYRFRMYRLGREQASLFVPLRRNIHLRTELYRRLGLDPDALADKRRFGKACLSAGLPVAATVADVADGEVRWWAAPAIPPCDLFVKEAASMCGAGATSWAWDGRGRWKCGQRHLDAPSLLSHLTALSARAPLLLQRRLANHPEVAGLGPRGLCTVRAVTLRSPADGVPEILLCAFRMPTGGEVADNFARGGLACAVDARDGTLGTAVRKDLRHAHLDVDRHPDTGAAIAGRRLPCWPAVVDLALRAHQAFALYPSVGWDIAITPDGPVLLEGNFNWDVVLGQQAGCRPLGATKWPRHLLEWATFAESRPVKPAPAPSSAASVRAGSSADGAGRRREIG